MELKINDFQAPQAINFNFEELKMELAERVKKYETLVYTDDNIKAAKADRADLNKLKKALNDERIRVEKEYMQPFNEFKTQIAEIIGIIDKPAGLIDKQVKEYEARKKEEKKVAIKEIFDRTEHPEWLEFDQMFQDDWLKSSYSMSHIEKQVIPDNIGVHVRNVATLQNLPEFGFEAIEVYKKTLDVNTALNKAKEMSEIAKKKAEATSTKNKQVEPSKVVVAKNAIAEERRQWVSFTAFLTVSQAKELKEFFDSRNIEFKPI